MAKTPEQRAAKIIDSMATKRSGIRVTYRPLNVTDPNVITWNRIKFEANVAVELDPKNKAHGYEVPLPRQTTDASGEVHTKHKETWVSMIELAKDNPSFEVEGFPRAKYRKPKGVVPPAGHEWAGTHEHEIDEESVAA
jgi:hypothetical protein